MADILDGTNLGDDTRNEFDANAKTEDDVEVRSKP